MRATFTERFIQEQKLSQQVSKVWGYMVSPTHLESSKVSRVVQKMININRNIKPIQMNEKKPIISSQHEQLIKQIAEIEHQKKMRKKAEQKNQVEFNVQKMMNDRVRQYNYLIDHKHIKEKNSEDTKRVLKLKPKSQAEKIVQEIKLKNQELIHTQDINKQFQLNKSIALLYRKYKQKMYEEHNENEEKKLHQTMVTSSQRKNARLRNKSIGSQGRTRNYSECLTNLKLKIDSQDNCQQTTNDNEQIDVKYPYMNDQEIKKNNQFQRKIQNNKEFLEMYKFKITTLKNFNKDKDKEKVKKPLSGKKRFRKQQDKEQVERIQNALFSGKDKARHTPEINQHLIAELRQKRKSQIKYFSSFLQKRNRKFKKPWGNKILIKYDSGSQAKNMLEGASATISPNKTQYFSATESHLGHQTSNKSASFYSIAKNIAEQDKMIYESMRQQREDPRLYETMCKNQKVNLFLKAAKRNKF